MGFLKERYKRGNHPAFPLIYQTTHSCLSQHPLTLPSPFTKNPIPLPFQLLELIMSTAQGVEEVDGRLIAGAGNV